MYSKEDDIRKAYLIKQYIENNPNCTRKDIVKNMITTWERINNLSKQGYLTLPKLKPYGERNGLFRKNS